MAANINPIFSGTPKSAFFPLVAAISTSDGTDANAGLILTAGSNGTYVNRIILQPRTTNTSPTTFPAGVFRVWINNGSTVATASNNTQINEILLPVATSNLSANTTTLVNYPVTIMMGFQLPANYTLYCGYTGSLSAAIILQVTTISGDY